MVEDEDPPRNIFSALWFRALVVVLVLGVIAAVAVPYVLDVVNPPTRPIAKAPGAPPPPPAMTPAPPTPPPAPVTAPPPEREAMPADPGPKPAEPARLADPPRPIETPKVAETTKRAPGKVAALSPSRATGAAGGPYWVQVGAFTNQATAKRMAERLREQKYKVVESTKPVAGGSPASRPAPGQSPSADLYDVFVSGAGEADLSTKLTGKGLGSEAVTGGVVVKPSLPLRDAVALSRDLAGDGLQVQVRRAGGAAVAGAPAAPSGDTYHRVRVGSFPDRAAAQAVLRELESKGYKPFIARGPE